MDTVSTLTALMLSLLKYGKRPRQARVSDDPIFRQAQDEDCVEFGRGE